MSAHMSDLMDTLRLSYGAGVVLKLGGIARLELNYCVPVKSQASDRYVCVSDSTTASQAIH